MALFLFIVLDVFPQNTTSEMIEVESHLKNGNFNQAITILTDLILKNPTNEIIYYWRAFSYFMSGDLSNAMVDIEKSISLKDKDSKSYTLKGDILLRMNQITDSLKYYNLAIQYDKTNPEAYLGAGIATIQNGDIDDAIWFWEEAIKYDPQNFFAYRNLAMAYQEKKIYDKSIYNWGKCIELNNSNPILYFERSRVYFNVNPGLALQDLNKAIELKDDFAQAYWTRGFIQKLFFRNMVESEKDFNKAVSIDERLRNQPYPDW